METPEPILDQQPPHSSKLKWLLIILVAALLSGAGAYYFLNFAESNDEPPTLSMDSSGLQGMLKEGKQGFLEYEATDTAIYTTIKNDKVDAKVSATTIKTGVNYYHADTDLTVKEIVECIDPVAQRVLVAYYSPGETSKDKAYHVFPKGPFLGTQTIADEATFTIPAGRGFAVIAKEASETYCFSASSEKSKVATANPVKKGEKGWALIAADKEKLNELLSPFKGQAVNVWAQDGDNSFTKIESTLTDGYTHTLSDHSLVWVKFLGPDATTAVVVKNLKPDAPANFVATEKDGKVELTWDAAEANDGAEIEGYIALYSIKGEGGDPTHINLPNAAGDAPILITDTKVTTPDDLILENDKIYRFQVVAQNKDGKTSDEAKIEFTSTSELVNLKPDAPANFVATEKDGKITLVWDAAEPNDGSAIEGYVVVYSIKGEGGDPTHINLPNAAGDAP
ncbi:hypothetical protein JKY72_04270, partial [Candidatus Gracilibacteria bacterium]|nr:hypothetical protein [Candidatus Gracilibacteria bacterium]